MTQGDERRASSSSSCASVQTGRIAERLLSPKRGIERSRHQIAVLDLSVLASQLETIVLYTIAVILLVLWVLGLATSFTAGGLLHGLLVIAAIVVVYQLITGRRVG
jgi:hypothetical protein